MLCKCNFNLAVGAYGLGTSLATVWMNRTGKNFSELSEWFGLMFQKKPQICYIERFKKEAKGLGCNWWSQPFFFPLPSKSYSFLAGMLPEMVVCNPPLNWTGSPSVSLSYLPGNKEFGGRSPSASAVTVCCLVGWKIQ